MKITYLGHSAFLLDFDGIVLLMDPFISPNPLSNVDVNTITCDAILVSHGHADHLADAELIAKKNDCPIISNFEITTWYGEKGVKGVGMNHGGKLNFNNINIKYVNAVHSSALPDGSNGGNPGGFVIWNENNCVYFAGDTALHMDMKLIPMTCPKVDVSIVPIGDLFTMGAEDAAITLDFVDCDHAIGCHYDTFDPIKIDKSAAKETFSKKGKKLSLLDINTSITI